MRKVLLDTSMVIRALDPGTTDAVDLVLAARKKLAELLGDADVVLMVSALIYFEATRGIKYEDGERLRRLDTALSGLGLVEVSQPEAELAARLTRFAVTQGLKLDKQKFDVLHFVCAQLNGLELESVDVDYSKITTVFNELKKQNLEHAKTHRH
jgi:predicted nucleic acid-binding protein